jgi:hypothetical protein
MSDKPSDQSAQPQRADFVGDIQNVASSLDKVPTREECRRHGAWPMSSVVVEFGSWNESLIAAGFSPNGGTSSKVSKDELIADVERVAAKLGEAPTKVEYDRYGDWSAQTVTRKFSRWNSFLKKAGLEVNHPSLTSSERTNCTADRRNNPKLL